MIQEKTILLVEDISLNPRGPRWHPPREYFFLDGLGPGAGFLVGRQPEYAGGCNDDGRFAKLRATM